MSILTKNWDIIVAAALVLIVGVLLNTCTARAATPFCYNTPNLPYEPHERWCKDGNTWWVTGRTELPLSKKLNPVWWFGNDYEPTAPAWYLPGNPARQTLWYLRNPLQNAGNYVFGTKDLNYTVRFVKAPAPGVGPVETTNMADLNKTGCIYTVLDNSHGGNLWFPRWYLSCTGKYTTWYGGTQWSGFYGFKFNILNSKFQLF